MRILLIDDQKIARKLIKSSISPELGEVVFIECEDGVEGIEAYDNEEDFDLVIVDFEMPNANGFEVVSHIRNEKKDKITPIMMCTSRNDKETVLKMLEAGVNEYLSKPFEDGKALDKVKRLLKRRDKVIAAREILRAKKGEAKEDKDSSGKSKSGEETAKKSKEEAGKKKDSSLRHGELGDDVIDDGEAVNYVELAHTDEDDAEAVDMDDDAFVEGTDS